MTEMVQNTRMQKWWVGTNDRSVSVSRCAVRVAVRQLQLSLSLQTQGMELLPGRAERRHAW